MGCFWGSEALFGVTHGVLRTRVGYSGGTSENPTYRNLADHIETVEIEYDTTQTTYENLLAVFWENHDPCVKHKRQYMSAIFYHDNEQMKAAEKSFEEAKKKCDTVHTLLLPAQKFYTAEDYHQKYRLRAHKYLLEQLELDNRRLLESPLAARLNGWLNGYGSLEQFEREKSKLGLKSDLIQYLIPAIKTAERHC